MATDDRDQSADATRPAYPNRTFVRITRATAVTLAAVALVSGLGLGVGSLFWLADLEAHPREPPGNIVAIVPMAGAGVGALLALGGVAGLIAVGWHARRSRRPTSGHRS